MSDLEDQIHRRLAAIADGSAIPLEEIGRLIRDADPLRPDVEVDRAAAAIGAQLVGLGAIDPLLGQPGVSDVLINGPGPVWVERWGKLERADVCLDSAQLAVLVQRIVAPLGRRADPVHSLVDGRLNDGSRVHIAMPPVAVDGPCVTIRRFDVTPIELDRMASPAVVALLRSLVDGRANVVVSGATGSGKTTLLNAMAGGIGSGERVVTIEEAAELRLGAPHVVRLEARPASVGGAPEVTVRDLVRNALRMRPDRIVVGEVRGAEAFDLLAALSTGHDGSLSTIHANSAVDAVGRLESLVGQAGTGLSPEAIRSQLGAALDAIVHVQRVGRARRVVAVVEVVVGPGGLSHRVLAEGDDVLASPLRLRATGSAP